MTFIPAILSVRSVTSCLSVVGCNGYEILEFNDAGDLELYVTKDMFIYLHQNGYFKKLMKIYNNRIWISTEEGILI